MTASEPDPPGRQRDPAIRLAGVTVDYGVPGQARSHRALEAVDVSVEPGSVVAVCGRNGAGKTTLLDLVTGFVAPATGTVRVLGIDPRHATAAHRARVGVALADNGLPPAASPRRLLSHLARLFVQPVPLDHLVAALDLGAVLDRPMRRLSTGERQRAWLGCALIGRPEVLVLDEPTSALDVAGRRAVLDLLRAARDEGAAVLWTSHTLADIERAGDRVVVLDHGRVLADGPPAELTGSADVIRFEAAASRDTAPLLAALPVAMTISESSPGHYEMVGERVDAAVLATVSTWQAANEGSGRLSVGPRGLEDVVMGLTGVDGGRP